MIFLSSEVLELKLARVSDPFLKFKSSPIRDSQQNSQFRRTLKYTSKREIFQLSLFESILNLLLSKNDSNCLI